MPALPAGVKTPYLLDRAWPQGATLTNPQVWGFTAEPRHGWLYEALCQATDGIQRHQHW
ncbi:hypothetical protein [Acaryochloris sp. CCMEE 5410]|uniref:hypothetical protein n=1 Tax=Acaryochloris sp. CCMEE 5410 TaxID=310037 RepID=UPI0021CE293E|nr:hypothetical protein [Acaryochloris sp. CCMEE 5410]